MSVKITKRLAEAKGRLVRGIVPSTLWRFDDRVRDDPRGAGRIDDKGGRRIIARAPNQECVGLRRRVGRAKRYHRHDGGHLAHIRDADVELVRAAADERRAGVGRFLAKGDLVKRDRDRRDRDDCPSFLSHPGHRRILRRRRRCRFSPVANGSEPFDVALGRLTVEEP